MNSETWLYESASKELYGELRDSVWSLTNLLTTTEHDSMARPIEQLDLDLRVQQNLARKASKERR